MKTISRFLLLIPLISTNMHPLLAQWFWQNPLPQGNTLTSVKFVSPTVGWAVGDAGTVISTANGGISWISQVSNTALDLKGVYFLNSTTGWVVGDNGIILRTTTGGTVWTIQRQGYDHSLFCVHFANENLGWAVGGNGIGSTILRTTNVGIEWISQQVDSMAYLRSVYFADQNNGWAVGTALLDQKSTTHTTDGGITWSREIGLPDNYSVTFSDTQHGWITGFQFSMRWGIRGHLLKTTDGGLTWNNSVVDTSKAWISVSFVDQDIGWIVDRNSLIRKTTDGGLTWVDQTSGTNCQLTSLCSIDLLTAWVVGIGGVILTTTNGGESWTNLSPQATTNYNYGVDFVDAHNGWVVVANPDWDPYRLYRTSDGGANWIRSIVPIDPFDVDFVDANTGWIVGCTGWTGNSEAKVIKTTDGGISWTTQYQGVASSHERFVSTYFIDQNTGWAVGSGVQNTSPYPIVSRTTDGGSNWISLPSPSGPITGAPNSVFFVDSNVGWIVGDFTTLFKTVDGGLSWSFQPSGIGPPYPHFLSVHFVDANTGWILGYGSTSTILKTSNGGTNWFLQQTPGHQWLLFSGDFVDANNGWVVGRSNGNTSILRTTNGGDVWTDQTSPVKELHDVCFVDQYIGWAVGEFGTILHTSNGGTTFVEANNRAELPAQAVLSQNYPNPFNASTKIGYQVAHYGLVMLKVYDVLGREVATLVNEVKEPGTYTVQWSAKGGSASGGDAYNLASGVYLCQLQTGSFTSVKKLLLLK